MKTSILFQWLIAVDINPDVAIIWLLLATGVWAAGSSARVPLGYCQSHLFLSICSKLRRFDCSESETFLYDPPSSLIAERRKIHETYCTFTQYESQYPICNLMQMQIHVD